MVMHDPDHPGEILSEGYLSPLNISVSEAAGKLDVSRSTVSRLIAPGSIPRSLLRTFNFEIWKLKCLGACPEDLYSMDILASARRWPCGSQSHFLTRNRHFGLICKKTMTCFMHQKRPSNCLEKSKLWRQLTMVFLDPCFY